jgi:sortase A
MTLGLPPQSLHRLLRWAQGAFFAVAIALFAYWASVTADAWIFQKGQSGQLDMALKTATAPAAVTPNAAAGIAPSASLIGRLEIDRLGVSVMVMEGTSSRTLRRAVGHIPGTALPGHAGNIGLSGHRDTFFRPLRNIRVSDLITVTTSLGEFHYRVVSTRIVDPHDLSVLESGETEILTLVTCYPFYFVGPAPGRFIVRAERLEDSL